MKKTFIFYILSSFILILSSINLAQETLSEPLLIFELQSEYAIRDLDWNFDSSLLAFVEGGEEVTIVDIETNNTEELDFAGERIAWNASQNYLLIANQVTKLLDYDEQILIDDFEFPTTEDYTPVGNVEWHPTENNFAIVLRGCDEGTNYRPGARIEIWDVETSTFTEIAECLWTTGYRAIWNPTGTKIAVNGSAIFDEDGFVLSEQIEIWDIEAAQKFLTITDLKQPYGLAWSPDGDMIAFTSIVGIDRFIQVWDVVNNELVWQVEANLSVYPPIDWHPSENLIATGGRDGLVRIWDSLNGIEIVELSLHDDIVNDISWSPDGNILASVGRDGQLFIWDVSNLTQ